MADSTYFIRPAEEAFRAGYLQMPAVPTTGYQDSYPWAEYPLNTILVVVSIVFFLIILDSFLHCMPYVLRCCTRPRDNFRIEDSVPLVRSRNWSFFATLLPFSLIASKYGFFDLDIIMEQPAEWKSLLVYAFFLLFILLRFIIYKIATPIKGSLETYRVAHRSAMNYFIPYTILLLITIAVLKLLNVDQSTAQQVFLWETAIVYFLYLLAKTQIFASSYGLLRTFLYLCGLELLPVAALAAAILWL